MPVIVEMGCFEDVFIKKDFLDATVKISTGRRVKQRVDILALLDSVKVSRSDLKNCYRLENIREWFVQFEDERDAEVFADFHDELYDSDGYTFGVCLLNRQIVNLRFHWVPAWVDEAWVERCCARMGKVIDIRKNREAYFMSTTYEAAVQCTLEQANEIPHLVSLREIGRRVLITMAGRPPLCLGCMCTGHVRARCPGQSRPAPRDGPRIPRDASRTYAGAVQELTQRIQNLPPTDIVVGTLEDGMVHESVPVPKTGVDQSEQADDSASSHSNDEGKKAGEETGGEESSAMEGVTAPVAEVTPATGAVVAPVVEVAMPDEKADEKDAEKVDEKAAEEPVVRPSDWTAGLVTSSAWPMSFNFGGQSMTSSMPLTPAQRPIKESKRHGIRQHPPYSTSKAARVGKVSDTPDPLSPASTFLDQVYGPVNSPDPDPDLSADVD